MAEPLSGTPSIRVCCRPVSSWEKEPARSIRGGSHVRYDVRGEPLRLLTDMPLTYLYEESLVALTSKMYFALTWGLGLKMTSSRPATNSWTKRPNTGGPG